MGFLLLWEVWWVWVPCLPKIQHILLSAQRQRRYSMSLPPSKYWFTHGRTLHGFTILYMYTAVNNSTIQKQIVFSEVSCRQGIVPQSRQSARLSLQSSELGPPPSHAGEGVPPLVPGEGHSRWGERGWGSRFQRGDRHCVLCGGRGSNRKDLL